MATRLRCDVDNYYSDNYIIDIIDTSYAGSIIDFKTYLEDCNFVFNGTIKGKGNTINTTEFKFKLLIENSDHTDFWEDMALQQEGRFFVKVSSTTSGDVTEEVRFVGHLVMDESYLQDIGGAQFIELRAADGLYRLTDQDYKSDADDQTNAYGTNIAFYEGYDTFLNIIYKCLDGLGTQDYYGASDEFLWINHNWYESGMGSIPVESIFEYARVNQRLFTEKNEDEEYLTMKKADVLSAILKAMHCQISYKWGSYFIDNINEKGLSGRTYKKYSKVGTFLTSATINATYTVDNAVRNQVALKGGKYSYLPPLKQTCVNLSFKLGNYGYTPNYWSNTESSLIELGDVEVTSESTALGFGVGVIFDVQEKSGVTLTSEQRTLNAEVYFGVTIKFGSYYYITEHTQTDVEYEDDQGNTIQFTYDGFEEKWSATPGVFLFKSKPDPLYQFLASVKTEAIINNIITTPLRSILDPASPIYNLGDVDTLSVKIEYVKIARIDDYTVDYDSLLDVTWNTWGFYITPIEEGEEVQVTDSAIKYCVENNINNSSVLEVDTIIGDNGFNSNNRIEVYDGVEWIGSTGSWGHRVLPAAGTGDRLQELLVEQMMRGQTKSIKRYSGKFENLIDPTYLVIYDGTTYIPSQFQYNLNRRRWSGDFYEHYYDSASSFSIQSSGTQVDTGNALTPATGTGNTNTVVSTRAQPVGVNGADSRTIDFTGYTLPNPDTETEGQINYLMEIYRGGVRLWYGATRDTNHYTIDYDAGTIILGRALRTGERLRGVIYEILS